MKKQRLSSLEIAMFMTIVAVIGASIIGVLFLRDISQSKDTEQPQYLTKETYYRDKAKALCKEEGGEWDSGYSSRPGVYSISTQYCSVGEKNYYYEDNQLIHTPDIEYLGDPPEHIYIYL